MKQTFSQHDRFKIRPSMQETEPKRIFLKLSISSRLKCPICYDVFLKPRRLFCGHTFCKACLKEMLKPHKNPEHVSTCPLCRVPIDINKIGYDLIAIKIIDQLQVACPVNGCPWKGQNQLLETHYNFECRLKNYINNYSQDKSINLTNTQTKPLDDDVTQKLNQNVQKGSLISRVISKNPHLLSLNARDRSMSVGPIYWQKEYTKEVKNMVTRGTQTGRSMVYKSKLMQREGMLGEGQQTMSIQTHNFNMGTAPRNRKQSEQRQKFNDNTSIYQPERPQINVINLQQNHKRIHVRRSRPGIFRL